MFGGRFIGGLDHRQAKRAFTRGIMEEFPLSVQNFGRVFVKMQSILELTANYPAAPILPVLERMRYIAKRLAGKRLTYKDLVTDNGKPSGSNDGSRMKRRWARIRAEWEEAQKQTELF